MKLIIYTGIVLLGLAFGSIPASAVSFDSAYKVERKNKKGFTSKTMVTHRDHFCVLTEVKIQETDTGGEFARCFIGWGATHLGLHAELGKNSDADVTCVATCYNN